MQDTKSAGFLSPFAKLASWSTDLPQWQQDALRRIIENGVIETDDINELTALCLTENGVDVESIVTAAPFTKAHIPTGSDTGQTVTLKSISDIENTNALEQEQELTFEDTGITIVFGFNGSGKSGYGRILRRSCRARNKGEPILPNVLHDGSTDAASAVITYSLDGIEQSPEQWIDGRRPVEPLGSVSFFDSQCAPVHVRQPNDIAFTPFGLDVLPKLGNACKAVQTKIDAERKRLAADRPKFLDSEFARGSHAVGKYLQQISAQSSIDELDSLASLSPNESKRLKEIPQLLANDPQKQAQEIRTRIGRVESIQQRLRDAEELLSAAAITKLKAVAQDADDKTKAANAAAKSNFASDPLPGIGDEAWRILWDAARTYSATAFPNRAFPVVDMEDAVCVLCQQTLSPDAKDRFARFDEFVSNETAKIAKVANDLLALHELQLSELSLNDEALKDNLKEIAALNEELFRLVRSTLAQLIKHKRNVLRAIKSRDWLSVKDIDVVATHQQLGELTKSLDVNANKREASASADKRRELVIEMSVLKAREWLATVVGDVKIHMLRLTKVELLNSCIAQTKTNRITAQSKVLAKEYVTDRLRNAFADEIKKMQQGTRRLNVELVAAAGEFGSSYYRVQLVGAHDAEIGRVVSEGEHRCIALAGFLSELATENSNSAIVFDDPVTSLDHNWRHCFATRLVQEAGKRQVIVFTHDIVFLHDLLTGAERSGVDLQIQRVKSGRDACGIVVDGLPWDAKKAVQRIDELEKAARATRADYDALNDDVYERDICHVYSEVRATVERTVEEIVLRGVVLRHRDYINLTNLKMITAFTEQHCIDLQNLFQRCCDITSAHDRSSLRSFGVPTPDDALTDLSQLRAIIDDIKLRQKAIT